MATSQPYASSGGGVPPDDGFPLRVRGRDGLGGLRAEPLRDALGADVVGRDQRDEQVDGSRLVRPTADGYGGLGRISVTPVRPDQGPTELRLSMTSRRCPRRGHPAARVEDHQTGLADDAPARPRGFENERTDAVSSPRADSSFDHRSGLLQRGDGLSVQAAHDHRVCEEVVQSLRISRSWRAETKPPRVDADLLPGPGVINHGETVAGAW